MPDMNHIRYILISASISSRVMTNDNSIKVEEGIIDEKPSALRIRAFDKPISVRGRSYWDSHAKMFNMIRLPAVMGLLFPQMRKRKIEFEVLCFPSKEELHRYLDAAREIPLLVNLSEIENQEKYC